MADFDLSEALETNSGAMPCHSCSYDVVDTEGLDFHFETKLVISNNQKTMKNVANLVVAISRMKRPSMDSHGLSDKKLYNIIIERLIKAKPAEMLESNGKGRVYRRARSVNQCTLSDAEQKDLVHNSTALKLHAITLQGGNSEHKVKFQMSRYITGDSTKAEGQPVILSITDDNLHLSCSMENEIAVLNIEKCSETDLRNISSEKNMDRFLFYGTIKGFSETKFESVHCPGWYISTSSEDDNLPVEMCQVDSANRITCFKLNMS